MPLCAALPFVAMLLAIAMLPLAAPRWWEPNRNELLVSCGLGLPVFALCLGYPVYSGSVLIPLFAGVTQLFVR